MLRYLSIVATVIAVGALAVDAHAQFDTNGPNAALTVQNVIPSAADPIGHIVPVAVPGDFDLDITAGTNPPQGFILITAPTISAGAFGVPWGGSIDIGIPQSPLPPAGIQVIVDSVFFTANPGLSAFAVTPFNLTLSLGIGLAGLSGPALQAIVADPTAAPFFLDNTEAVFPSYQALTVTVYDTLGDDAFQPHNLDPVGIGSPITITFGGTTYTSLFVGSNGALAFGAGSSSFNTTLARFFAGFQTAPTGITNPGVAVWEDLNPSGFSGTDNVTVVEDLGLGTVQVQYNNQEHWNSNLTAGSWSITFGGIGPNSVTFDMSGYIGGDPAIDFGPIIGLTDGTSLSGTDRTSDLSVDIGSAYTTAAGPESIAEDTDPYFVGIGLIGQPLDFTVLNAIDIGNGGGIPYFTWTLF